MMDFEPELLEQNPEWVHVLEAYRSLHQKACVLDPDGNGWLSRISSVDHVPSEQLPSIHGKLIALGLLEFQLAGRMDGVQYRLSPEGRRGLEQSVRDPCEINELNDWAQSA